MKCSYSENELFEFLSGRLEAAQAGPFESHLSGCEECAPAAALVRSMRLATIDSFSNENAADSEAVVMKHPDIGKLAEFFYETASPEVTQELAAHIALCSDCSTFIAQYATASALALEYVPAEHEMAMPQSAWRLINEWEEGSVSDVRPLEVQHTAETIDRILMLLKEKAAEIAAAVARESSGRNLVPVLVVDRLGSYRRIELFERAAQHGGDRLRHAEGSTYFHMGSLHTIVASPQGYSILTRSIGQDSVRPFEIPISASPVAHFIVEE